MTTKTGRALFDDSPDFRDSTPAVMPQDWKNPLRVEMYQIVVTRTNGEPPCFFGPAMTKDALGPLVDEINAQIASGRETRIAEPTLVRVPSIRS